MTGLALSGEIGKLSAVERAVPTAHPTALEHLVAG